MISLRSASTYFTGPGGRARVVFTAVAVACVAIFFYLPSPTDSYAEIEKAKAADEKVDWKDKADFGESLAAALNFFLTLVLILAARRWTRPLTAPDNPAFPAADSKKVPRWFWPGVLAAVLLAGALRYNLASKSLWWDELWNVKQASNGQWRTGSKHPDELRFYPSDWQRCAWYYQKPTNHAALALGSKLSLTLWRTLTDAPKYKFSDLAVRLPALLAALLSVAMAAWVFRIWGLPGTGVVAALLLAIHPYHIRYGIDARGYTLVVLGTLLAIAGLSAIFRKSGESKNRKGQSWKPYLLFGLGQFLIVWSSVFVGLFSAGGLFLIASILVFRSWKAKPERIAALIRLAVANIFAAMAFLQVFAPNLLQIEDILAQESVVRPLTAERLQITTSNFLLGVDPTWGSGDSSTGLVSLADRGGWPTAIAIGAFALLGLYALARHRRHAFWILLTMALSAGLYLAFTHYGEFFYYHRFMIGLFTGTVLAIAAGMVAFTSLFTKNPAARSAISGVLLGLFTWAAWPQIAVLNSRPYAPLREVAEFLEEKAKSDPDSISAIGYGLGGRIIRTYNPAIKDASSDLKALGPEDFEAELASARSEGRPLYVAVGYDEFNRLREPWAFPLLDDPSQFELVRTFRGIEPDFTFRIFRLK